jgi:hypothetical protein
MSSAASWKSLAKELRQRTSEPVASVSYVLYFVLAVVVAGGAGVWLELTLYLVHEAGGQLVNEPPDALKPVLTAVITFFSALAGSAAMQLIWAEDRNKPLRAYATLVLVVSLIVALLIGLLPTIGTKQGLAYGALATLFSLWTWWIANANDPDIRDKVDPYDAVGGDNVEAPLAGNLQGFTTK